MQKAALWLFLFFLQAFAAYGQFALRGQAARMDGECIQLTPDSAYAEGLAFHHTPLDLNQPFMISFDLFFGDKEEGADGMTFTIHNDPRGLDAFGTWGECMGYGRWNGNSPYGNSIAPSIAIEFDTYQNSRQNDPATDHVAWLENGSSYHSSHWPAKGEQLQLEDGLLHDFVFQWDPAAQRITVMLDGQVVIDRQQDLINDVFDGQTQVIWGFSASTGRKFNLQYFCLRRLAQLPDDQLPEELTDR